MIVNLKDPDLEITVDKDIKAQDLEAVAFSFMPPPIELVLLFLKTKRLHSEDTFLTDLDYLFEQRLGVNLFFVSQLLKNVRKGLFT